MPVSIPETGLGYSTADVRDGLREVHNDGMEPFLGALRDRRTGTAAFRAAARILCLGIMRKQKALLKKRGMASEPVVLVVILRAAIALLDPALRVFPDAPVGVFGMKRDERTKVARWYYENLPRLSKRSVIIVLDPMLATGGSAEAAVRRLVGRGADPKRIYFIGVVAAPEGVARLARRIPRGNITLAAVDEKLDAGKMIVPGLGDFGDRYFGYDRT